MASKMGDGCWRTAGLLGGGRGELHPRENGWLDPWGGMLLVGARIWKVPHLHTQKQQGLGKGTFKGHTEKKGSPAQDISAIRLAATSPPVLAALEMHEFMIACYMQWARPWQEKPTCWILVTPSKAGEQ